MALERLGTWLPGATVPVVVILIVMRETFMKRPLSELVSTAKLKLDAIHNA